jgi:hypothetical protein
MQIEYERQINSDVATSGYFPSSYYGLETASDIHHPALDNIYRIRSDTIRMEGTAYLTYGDGFSDLEALGPEPCMINPGQRILIDGPDELAFIIPNTRCRLRRGVQGIEITFGGNRSIATVRLHKKDGHTAYTSPDMPGIFDCVSSICSDHAISSPDKSNPLFRGAPPSIKILEGFTGVEPSRQEFSLHLPHDLQYLYTAAPLAYYLGTPIELSDRPYITFDNYVPLELPSIKKFEVFASEALRRTFYMDCAVRYETRSGKSLPGMNVRRLLGYSALEIYDMSMEERFMLYDHAEPHLSYPCWHMASYLDPIPKSVETLPFLLRSLSTIYAPEGRTASEREIVASSVRKPCRDMPAAVSCENRWDEQSAVMPSLHGSSSSYWFSSGYPIDAVKSSYQALESRRRFDISKGRRASVLIICNESSMADEAFEIEKELNGANCDVEILQGASVREFADAFSIGYNIVEFIGHCCEDGFRCGDGYAHASDVEEDHTAMFFFNSCSSHAEALRLMEKGSACGIAAMFRMLEDAAMDVSRNFYRMFGAGYSALTSLNAAKDCSVLGNEYLLLGDGTYSCFESGGARPFFEILRHDKGYSLLCTMDNVDKGSIVTSWHRSNKKPVTDLGFETHSLTSDHLLRIGRELKGYCLYGRNIYRSVSDAAKQLKKDEESIEYRGKRSRFPGSRL